MLNSVALIGEGLPARRQSEKWKSGNNVRCRRIGIHLSRDARDRGDNGQFNARVRTFVDANGLITPRRLLRSVTCVHTCTAVRVIAISRGDDTCTVNRERHEIRLNGTETTPLKYSSGRRPLSRCREHGCF